jgi:hypothetical protein
MCLLHCTYKKFPQSGFKFRIMKICLEKCTSGQMSESTITDYSKIAASTPESTAATTPHFWR